MTTSQSENEWIEIEMKRLELGDERLEARTRKILADFSRQPTASIAQFCGDAAAIKGAYGYYRNKGVARAAMSALCRSKIRQHTIIAIIRPRRI